MKLKCPNLLKPLDTIIQENYQPFYPSEPFRITRFQMRHPVLVFQNQRRLMKNNWVILRPYTMYRGQKDFKIMCYIPGNGNFTTFSITPLLILHLCTEMVHIWLSNTGWFCNCFERNSASRSCITNTWSQSLQITNLSIQVPQTLSLFFSSSNFFIKQNCSGIGVRNKNTY